MGLGRRKRDCSCRDGFDCGCGFGGGCEWIIWIIIIIIIICCFCGGF